MPDPESVTVATDDLAVAPVSHTPETPPIVLAYSPAWPNLFAEAKAQILNAVAPHIQSVHHVGSTSVPDLAAKPVIDILVGVHDWNEACVTIAPLQRLGWEFRGPRGIPRRHYFVIRLPDGSRTHHLHMLELASTPYTDMLAFRNHLRTHPTAATQYATLKRRLATQPGAYQHSKAPFIQRILCEVRSKNNFGFQELSRSVHRDTLAAYIKSEHACRQSCQRHFHAGRKAGEARP